MRKRRTTDDFAYSFFCSMRFVNDVIDWVGHFHSLRQERVSDKSLHDLTISFLGNVFR